MAEGSLGQVGHTWVLLAWALSCRFLSLPMAGHLSIASPFTAPKMTAFPSSFFLLEFLQDPRWSDATSLYPKWPTSGPWETVTPSLSPKHWECSPLLTQPLLPFLRQELVAITPSPLTAGNILRSSLCGPKETCHSKSEEEAVPPFLGLCYSTRPALKDPPQILLSLHTLTHFKYHWSG